MARELARGVMGKKAGTLDPRLITEVVRANTPPVRRCYESELKRDPRLAGEIEVELTISPSGRVATARISSDTVGSKAVASCVLAKIRRWRFPAPTGGSVTVAVPFVLAPAW